MRRQALCHGLNSRDQITHSRCPDSILESSFGSRVQDMLSVSSNFQLSLGRRTKPAQGFSELNDILVAAELSCPRINLEARRPYICSRKGGKFSISFSAQRSND